jgi:imidazolonepropionase-like amidohydrolase
MATDTVAPDQKPTPERLARARERATTQYQRALQNLARVHAAGIPVVMGTDAGNPLTLHGASVFMELEAMEAAGLSPMDVLVAATRVGARAMGLDSVGTVTPGAVADLVVLDADPLAGIRNVRRIALVARGGEIYTRRELEYQH